MDIHATMQNVPLTLTAILDGIHGTFGDSGVLTYAGANTAVQAATFSEIATRAAQLASGLAGLGIEAGDRVATFMWNNQRHVEAYLAVPCSGAILHTLNIRLTPEQLGYIACHAGDKIIIVDASLLDTLLPALPLMPELAALVIAGDPTDAQLAEVSPLVPNVIAYEQLVNSQPTTFAWPVLDEHSAAAMCYTSGTTGDPKGVVYSHRSVYLHALAVCTANVAGISSRDRVLPIVPMFHVNAWGIPYASLMAGATLILPDRHLKPDTLVDMIAKHGATLSGGVPTVFNDMLLWLRDNPGQRIDSLRRVLCGGAAVPASLVAAYRDEFAVPLVQAWGMTETSPIVTIADVPDNAITTDQQRKLNSTGRFLFGAKGRVVDETGAVLPRDGRSVGEVQVRGPWITGGYHGGIDAESFSTDSDGQLWLHTGDIGHISADGYLTLTDRAKDVIKSGGEWISSVHLETTLAGHPDVVEAAVIGVPDTRWDERPLALVTLRPGSAARAEDLKAWLEERVQRWWLPERWAVVGSIARTGVGKYDKKLMRQRYHSGEIPVTVLPR